MAYGKRVKPNMYDWTPEKIKELREAYGESQPVFALRFRQGVDSLRKWEQGKATPTGAVTVVLDHLAASVPTNGKPTNGHARKAATK